MKIAYSSDFHIDASQKNREAVHKIVRIIGEAEPDVIVIAGDVGNTLVSLEDTLALLSHLNVPKLFVAGNHDVWIEKTNDGHVIDSRRKYDTEIPRACRRTGFCDLTREPRVIDGVGFAGSLGWYDYSFADSRLGLTHDQYWQGRYQDEIWWDKDMALWPPAVSKTGMPSERLRDPEVCRELTGRLERHVAALERRADEIIVVIHTLPFLVTLPRSEPPKYLDAFTGSEVLGRMLESHSRVTHCIGGHKHLSGDWRIGHVWAHRRTLGRVDTDTPVDVYARRAVGVITI
ncbi:MAG: metallophosphoesterase [Candidatus Krumholzibacteria bacterium]|nr:metallophosphoesterase [Candidatus Krumholzibacteria bacterium]